MAELPATLTGLQQEIARGRLSAAEAITIQRGRLRQRDDSLGAVVSVPVPPAPQAAMPAGRLAGIGLAHKDIFDTAGFRPGLGHDRGAPEPGRREARVIARLSARGATHLARLAMAEYACGATGANDRLGPCRNPLGARVVVGGSSSGSAVAVAGGLAYGSLGTDTGGSVRIPAATCGLVGLKTTHGLVSRDGVFPLAPSLDSVGILARTPSDAAELLRAVSERPLAGSEVEADGCRVRFMIPAGVDAEVADALAGFAKRWPAATFAAEPAGSADPADPGGLRRLGEMAEALMAAESAEVHHQALLEGRTSVLVEAVALAGLAIRPQWAASLRAARAASLRAFVAQHLTACDLLVLPAFTHPLPDWPAVTPGDPAYDGVRHLGLFRLMGFVNYLGLPAVVLPIAADRRGLPISIQVLARPYADARLLAWAAHADRHCYEGRGFPGLRH